MTCSLPFLLSRLISAIQGSEDMGGTQWLPPMALPCPPSAGVTDTCLAFKWVLGIQKEVLVLCTASILSAEPSP